MPWVTTRLCIDYLARMVRINEIRLAQLASANPDTVAVWCPLCMTMMEDAVKSLAPDASNRVMDLAEIIAQAAGIPS